MSQTGHGDFDRLKDEFSATIQHIEATLRERVEGVDNDNAKKTTRKMIQKASSLLSNLSSAIKSISESGQPALRQELVDIYKACKMQLKTYKSLASQSDMLFNTTREGGSRRAIPTETLKKKGGPTSLERSELFSSASKPTKRDGDDCENRVLSNFDGRTKDGSQQDRIAARTQGKVRHQNSRLQDALKSLQESEDVANEITGELFNQRESLEITTGRLDQFTTMTEYSNGLLNSMNKPWWQKW